MKTKLDLAHEYVMNYLLSDSCENCRMEDIVSGSWEYADAMYAEMEKREDKSLPDILFDKHDGRVCHCGNVKDETK